jgi:ubiquinone biosynthesis protein
VGLIRTGVSAVSKLSVGVRDMERFRQVGLILAKYGLSGLLAGRRKLGEEELSTTPQHLTQAIQELGPTFIKFGQILSTRPDIMSDEYLDAFQSLQDEVSSLPFSDVSTVLEMELPKEWRENFLNSIDETPIATASIAQVHLAELKNGDQVVLKIQRPHIEKQIQADLSILSLILEQGLREFPELELFDPRGMFLQFKRSLLAELDFVLEKKNLQRFYKNFEHFDEVIIPTIVEECSTKRVLCMEFLEGVKIRKAREQGFDMKLIGERYLTVAYSMLFEHGFFHGDLHPGNVLILEGHRIGVIDCGMVGYLTQDMKDVLATLIFCLYRGDHQGVARTFFELSIKEGRVDYGDFERDAIYVAEQHWSGGSFAEMNIGGFLMDLTRGALKHRVRAPTEFTMFFKGVLTTEGLAKSLLPEVDPLAAAQPYIEKMVQERWQPQRWSELGLRNISSFSNIAKRLPISISQLLDDLEQQRFRIQQETYQSPADRNMQLRIENTKMLITMSGIWLILAGILQWSNTFLMYKVSIPSVLCLFIGGSFQAIAIYRMWRT